MSLRSNLSKGVGKLVRFALKITKHKATSLPGYLALKIDKDILDELSYNTKFIFVTGTNGKTMTTHFLTKILQKEYRYVYTNDSGSNMIQGIVTSLLDNKKNEESVAVLEVDEANLVKIGKYLKADYVVFTNIFRDQMDRFGEIYNIYDKLMEGMDEIPDAKLILNGDLPIFNYEKIRDFDRFYYGIRDYNNNDSSYELDPEFNSDGIICPNCHSIIKYRHINYGSLGDYKCPTCDFKSPSLDIKIDRILSLREDFSKFMIDDNDYEVNVGGLYNIYNALAAISTGVCMGISYQKIKDAIASQKNIFGRQENIKIGEKNLTINLVKNPTGLNQIIDLMLLNKDDISLICLLNDRYADGLDVSWIYDSNFEKLKDMDIRDVYVSGIRKKDMKRRLEIAEIFDGDIKEFSYEDEIIDIVKNTKSDQIYLLSTYTAMLKLREVLNLK